VVSGVAAAGRILLLLGLAGCAHPVPRAAAPAPPASAAVPGVVDLPCPEGTAIRARTYRSGTVVGIQAGPARQGTAPVGPPQVVRLFATSDLTPLGTHAIDAGQGNARAIDLLLDGTVVSSDGQVVHGALGDVPVFSLPIADLGMLYPPVLLALPTGNWIAGHASDAVALVAADGRILVRNDLRVRAWAVSPDGERLAVVRFVSERRVSTLDIHDGRTGAVLSSRDVTPDERFDRMLYAPDHATLFANAGPARLTMSDGTSGVRLHTFGTGGRSAAHPVGVTRVGDVLVDTDGGLQIWAPASARMTARAPWAWEAPAQPAPDGCFFDEETFPCPPATERTVAYASEPAADGWARFALLPGSPGPATVEDPSRLVVGSRDSVVFSSDGTHLLVLVQSTQESEVRAWDLATREVVRITPVPMSTDGAGRFVSNVDGTEALLVAPWRASVQHDAGPSDLTSWNHAGLGFDLRTGRQVAWVPDGPAIIGFRADGAMLSLDCE
jgi:hypothetical protein